MDNDPPPIYPTNPPPVSDHHAPRRGLRRIFPIAAAILLVALSVAVFNVVRTQHPKNNPANSTTHASSTPTTIVPAIGPGNIKQYLAAAVASPTNIWAIGAGPGDNNSTIAVLQHFDGTRWTTDPKNIFTFPNNNNPGLIEGFQDIACTSATDCWAVGSIAAHYTQGQWVKDDAFDTFLAQHNLSLSNVQMLSPTDGWAWGSHAGPTDFSADLFHLTNGVWQEVGFQFAQGTGNAALAYSPAPGHPVMKPYSTIDPNLKSLFQVEMVSDAAGWAIGWYQGRNAIWHYLNGEWHVTLLSPINTTNVNLRLGANAANDAWLVGGAGDFTGLAYAGTSGVSAQPLAQLDSGITLEHYSGTNWTSAGSLPGASTDSFMDGAKWLPTSTLGAVGTVFHNQGGHWVPTTYPRSITGSPTNSGGSLSYIQTGHQSITSPQHVRSVGPGATTLAISTQPNGDAIAVVLDHAPTLHVLRFSNGTWSVMQ